MTRFRHAAGPARLALMLTALLALGACSDPATAPEPFVPAASVEVAPDTATIEIYDTLTLSATVLDADGMVLSAPTVLWESSDTTVATVSAEGHVRGAGDGTARITARSGGASGGMDIVVFDHHDGFLWTAFGHADYPFSALHLHEGQLIGATGARAFRWTGSAWDPFGPSLGNRGFNAFTTWAGNLLASCNITEFDDGTSAWGIVRWDGTRWLPLEGLTGWVYANAFGEYEGELVVGGVFDYYTFPGTGAVRRWDGTAWTPLGEQGPRSVYALLVHDGSLYAAGLFPETHPPGLWVTGVWRWDGTQWHPIGAGLEAMAIRSHRSPGAVRHLIAYQGDLIAATEETMGDRSSVFRIARWDGASWSQLGEQRYGRVTALAVYRGDLFVGASGSMPIARWDGASWLPLRKPPVRDIPGFGPAMSGITGLIVYEDRLVATGDFTRIGGVDASRIASWGPPR